MSSAKVQIAKTYIPKSWQCLCDYSWETFRKDLLAGVTVGIVALPLAMAFAIASGVGPEKGLYTAIIAGFLISLLGGSKVQIGGPTGAFVVIVYDVIQRQGYDGLVLATLIAGVLLILMGLCRLGTWIKFIPYPLVIGFTSGIAVLIFFSQLKNFFGLKLETVPVNFIEQLGAYAKALPALDPIPSLIGIGTLGVILLIRRFIPSLPWGIASMALATLICWAFQLPVTTIGEQFGEIPRTLPSPGLPTFNWSFQNLQSLIPDAFVIAFLAGVESLLSAVVADGMTGGKHRSNCELVAQGLANIGSMFFGGIPATGAIARTATSIKTGAKTPMAGMIHAVTLFLIMLLFAPLVGKIPLPALSAILIMIAWNMSEIGHFRRVLKAPLGDVAVLLTTFFLTVLIDLTAGVEVGIILAAFLFMKRMSDIPGDMLAVSISNEEEDSEKKDPDAISKKHVPPGVEVYEINGPFFFGVADRLKDILTDLEKPPKVFILRLRKVPLIDATGMNALIKLDHKCKKEGSVLILSGVHSSLRKTLEKFEIDELVGKENICPHIDQALARARLIIKI